MPLAAVKLADPDLSSGPFADLQAAPRTALRSKYLTKIQRARLPDEEGTPDTGAAPWSDPSVSCTKGPVAGFSTYSARGAMINMRMLSAQGRYNLQQRLILATQKCKVDITALRKAHEFQPDFVSDNESQVQVIAVV
jgi:hypothetical protein